MDIKRQADYKSPRFTEYYRKLSELDGKLYQALLSAKEDTDRDAALQSYETKKKELDIEYGDVA